jgi:hypothetical protein
MMAPSPFPSSAPNTQPILRLTAAQLAYVATLDVGPRVPLEAVANSAQAHGWAHLLQGEGKATGGPSKPRMTESLLGFLYGTRLNYGPTYLRTTDALWVEVPVVDASIPGGAGFEHLRAVLVLHLFRVGVAAAYLLLEPRPDSSRNPEEIISLGSQPPELRWRAEARPQELASALAEIAKELGLPSLQLVSTYPVQYWQRSPDAPELQAIPEVLYAILEADLTYYTVAPAIIRQVTEKNISMIRDVAVYFGRHRGTVIFTGPPARSIGGVTGLEPDQLVEAYRREREEWGNSADPVDALEVPRLAPFIDYLVELEPLRIELALLARYNRHLSTKSRTRQEIAALKAYISSELDFYYALSAAAFSGVNQALDRAKQEMGVDKGLELVNRRLELLEDALQLGYDTRNELLQTLFTLVLTAFALATIAQGFVFAYDRAAPFESSLALLVLVTAGGTLLVGLAMWILSRKPKLV